MTVQDFESVISIVINLREQGLKLAQENDVLKGQVKSMTERNAQLEKDLATAKAA